MKIKELLVIFFCISLLPSFLLALTETYGEVVNLRTVPLKVRDGPGVDYDRIDELQLGHIVKIVRDHGSWYEIEYNNGLMGFSYANYIDILPQNEYKGYVKVVVHQWLNVRSGPSHKYFHEIYVATENSILRTLSETSLNQNSSWFRVQDRNGAAGYVNGNPKYVMPLYEDYYELSAFQSFNDELQRDSRIQSRPQPQELFEDEVEEIKSRPQSQELSEDELMLDTCFKDIKRKQKGCHSVCLRNSDTSEELKECKFECKTVFKGRRSRCFDEYKEL